MIGWQNDVTGIPIRRHGESGRAGSRAPRSVGSIMSGIVDLLRELAEFGERLSQGPSGGFKFGPETSKPIFRPSRSKAEA